MAPALVLSLLAEASAAAMITLPGAVSERMTLSEAWTAALGNHSGNDAEGEELAAGQSDQDAVRRHRLPVIQIDAVSDYGQRVRPGEERAQGIGSRGEIVARVAWPLIDSAQSAREAAQDRRIEELKTAGLAFNAGFLAALSRSYVTAAEAERTWMILQFHSDQLDELARIQKLRSDAGVDDGYDAYLMSEAKVRSERLLTEAIQRLEVAQEDLSYYTGKGARTAPIAPATRTPAQISGFSSNPEVLRLRQRANTLRAQSVALQRQDQWRMGVFGAAGPYLSRAFEPNRVEREYIVGLGVSWNPDLARVRRHEALAEWRRAHAAEAQAGRLEREIQARIAATGKALARDNQRMADLDAEVAAIHAREEAALLRWQNGMAHWRDILDARETMKEAHIQKAQAISATALSLVDYAEWTGQIEQLPAWLGQTGQ